MTRGNVRIGGIVHAHAINDEQITRCGTRYARNGQHVIGEDLRPTAHKTRNDVDCMTCLVRDEWAHAGIREIIVENSVKDLADSIDASLMAETEGRLLK